MRCLLCLVCILFIVSSALGGRIWVGNEYNDYLARKYLDADLVVMEHVTSSVMRTIDQTDSLGTDGWIYHRVTIVALYDASVDSVLKGDCRDSIITFQSLPYTERSRSRLVRPSDSLHVVERSWPFADGDVPGCISGRGRCIVFLKKENDAYLCVYSARPEKLVLDVLRAAAAEGEAYFRRFEPQR